MFKEEELVADGAGEMVYQVQQTTNITTKLSAFIFLSAIRRAVDGRELKYFIYHDQDHAPRSLKKQQSNKAER